MWKFILQSAYSLDDFAISLPTEQKCYMNEIVFNVTQVSKHALKSALEDVDTASRNAPTSVVLRSKKKGAREESKLDHESEAAKAKANATLWEVRLGAMEQSRVEYRQTTHKLAVANEELIKQNRQLEKDTVDVVAFLKKKDIEKDHLIEKMKQEMLKEKQKAHEEKELMIQDYTRQLSEMDEKLNKKANEIQIIQGELKMLKDFRRKRAQLLKELDDIKDSMQLANNEHKETIYRMEHKFFEEKIRLEKEAEEKISQLAERAHNEAIVKLDETSRSVFKENIRLREALSYHMKESTESKKLIQKLQEKNEDLSEYKETNDLLVQQKVSDAQQQKQQIQELQAKIDSLEKNMSHMTHEYQVELHRGQHQALMQTESSRVELDKLQKLLEMKDREMNRVKKLAKNILDQRTEVETFFLDSLNQVKQEILASRRQYKQAAQAAYQQRMRAANAGKEDFPKIRTFSNGEHSTNDVHHDLEQAAKWANVKTGKVDISELTWEQREQVLRLLFAKMNGLKTRKPSHDLPLTAPDENGHNMNGVEETCVPDVPGDQTFITQQVIFSETPVYTGMLPDISHSRHLVELSTNGTVS
ncbi:basal body-orientation factor 1 [Protopterus annectens]|uniref:basal body-orientation factor 1 n=1 Tax=Protopterus annectens TaxID=7888 RepID=UPI001CFB84EC|nr:basal body-orientation factor 1 [Protopterus annectens]